MELGVLNRTSNIILICVCLILSLFTAFITYDIYIQPNTTEVTTNDSESLIYSYSGNYLISISSSLFKIK